MWQEAWGTLILYSPLGVVGVWRWGVWLYKKITALGYRSPQGEFIGAVSVVTPVYNENPEVFQQALESWQKNKVAEIIAVIDFTDERCLEVFQKFSKNFFGSKLIITKTPGKRPALATGIQVAASPFIALVDSDTVWGENVRRQALIPFRDEKVGGVATYQRVANPETIAQRIFNIQLNMRYLEELPFLMAGGGEAMRCISGRTAFYRRAAILPLLNGLLTETFLGQPVVSGDDKRLTYLVQAAGWKTVFQQQAHVYTPGTASLAGFFKQRLRWTRNSWRADLKVLKKRWVWRHPRLAFHLIDNIFQPFAQILSPAFFLISIYLHQWLPALVLFTWWHAGRAIRLWPHLKRRPQDISLLPIMVVYNFCSAVIKIYGLFTLSHQGWITRWDKSRLPQFKWLSAAPGYIGTAAIVFGFGSLVFLHEAQVVAAPPPLPKIVIAKLGVDKDYPPDELVILDRYVVQPGDTLAQISQQFNMPVDTLVAANSAFLPSQSALWPGMVLTIPRQLDFQPAQYENDQDDVNYLAINYDEATNTINVRGRGQVVRLWDVMREAGREHIQETAPGKWRLSANLFIRAGVSLQLTAPEVTELTLQNAWLRTTNGQIIIDGVKITGEGKGYIAATHGSRLDILNSDIAFLGSENETAVQWTVPKTETKPYLLTGVVKNSSFHDLLGGAKVIGATGMTWDNNKFWNNRD